ncbi:MAG TPA: glycosyltransferase [Candidatus Nanoarchaeia archaeon]|nr:glycosyltransferase [Candidatus Nanoarchaeia archaeon]
MKARGYGNLKGAESLSVILPSYNEQNNVGELIRRVKSQLQALNIKFEVIVVDGGSRDNTVKEAAKEGAKVIIQKSKGYGGALLEGFALAKGDYVLTMDSDMSHDPVFIKNLWMQRSYADIIIASRYVKGGKAKMSLSRTFLSKSLNAFFARALSLPLKDLSSGYRMYKKEVVGESLQLKGTDFNILQEIVVQAYNNGWIIKEEPFYYRPRKFGKSKAKLAKFACSYLITLGKMWKMRNSIEAADYDDRAYNSKILPQRLWQRARHKVIMSFLAQSFRPSEKPLIVDIGCGSNKLIQQLNNSIGIDIMLKKLMFLRSKNKNLLQASIFNLPLKSDSIDCIICSEVIEHLQKGEQPFLEITRVLKRGGILILGTPDYSRASWHIIEWIYSKILPNAYADEHISPYSRKSLKKLLGKHGFNVVGSRYVFGSELILRAIKK